jgi:PAS domain-containing protein
VLGLSDIILVACAVVVTTFAALFMPLRRSPPTPQMGTGDPEPLSLLFDDGFLHHATHRALTQLAISPGFNVWDDLRDGLLARFPDLPASPGCGDIGSMTLTATDHKSPHRVEMNWRGSLCWVTLVENELTHPKSNKVNSTDDLAALRLNAQFNPHPMWHLDRDGQVIWQNAAYKALRAATPAKIKPLFETPEFDQPHRTSLPFGSTDDLTYFEVTANECGDTVVCHATCIDGLVAAEKAKRHFVQTLSKTFAHLPIGLAIFDRNGQLALFNPALVDLSGLSAPFLSRRPTIMSFFDQMRENRQMPEPKNYISWRQAISELITAAADGLYQDTWTLEDGRTYAVQGRPHPDGATAFLIEDISAEITLTRNFRKEVELGQTLLDQVEEGLVVFSSSGVLTFCNERYRSLWGQIPESAFADVTIFDCIGVWRAGCDALPHRDEIERFVMSYEDQKDWSLALTLNNGRPYVCELRSIGAGSKLIRFREARPLYQIPYMSVHQEAK